MNKASNAQDNNDIRYVNSASPNFQTEFAQQLANLVPEAVADGKIDIEKLRELLAEDTADSTERFGLFWPGKKRALRAAQLPTTATLKPDIARSKDWDASQNVFIEGDNLEVLKILQRHYHNKIKMIYIDPPYNTGKDFVYPDNYKEGLENYLQWTKQVNEEGKKVSANSETEGRYHSNWLNMMYPRLKLARNLLTDDGVIFISIDDNEQDNLKKVCNEIFGENNFISTIVWQKRTSPDARLNLGAAHDYVLVFAKSKSDMAMNKLPLSVERSEQYKNPDNDERGVWASVDITGQMGHATSNQYYEIETPAGIKMKPPVGRCWAMSDATFKKLVEENRIWFGEDGKSRPRQKRFLSETDGANSWTWWNNTDVGHNQEATKEVKSLFPDALLFDTPKPTRLIKRMLQLCTQQNKADIVLDFFSGSATTADAVMQLNAEDGGNRRFIMVQLPEPIPEDSEARKAGFNTIADISRKRIELAGEKIKADSPLTTQELDVGFRAYTLTDTHFAKWRVKNTVEPNKLEQHLLALRDSADDNASIDDLLTEILLKNAYSLTATMSDANISGLQVKWVDASLLAYLDEHQKPSLEQLRQLVDAKPERLMVLEDAFQGDDELKTNLVQYAKSKGVELFAV